MTETPETIDSQMLAIACGGAMTKAAMTNLVDGRLKSSFGPRGAVTIVGKQSYGPNRRGTVMGHGKFSIRDSWDATEMRSWNAVLDVDKHRVEHLHTGHLWTSD